MLYYSGMIILWIVLITVVLALVFCVTVLAYKAKEVERRKSVLKESLWKRHHRIPLLVELISRSNGKITQKAELIDLRAKVSTEAYSFREQIDFEKQMTSLLNEIIRMNESRPELKSDAVFLSVKKELEESTKAIMIAVNDYNFLLQMWEKGIKLPWFAIFAFLFKIDKTPLVWDVRAIQ